MAPTDHTPSSDEGNHGDHMTQLWQVADDAISEAASLIERMKSTSSKLPSEGSKGAGPGYVPGVDHVSRLIEEIQNHRHRVGQLAEARRLQGEELRRLHSCERDTSQVSVWCVWCVCVWCVCGCVCVCGWCVGGFVLLKWACFESNLVCL